MYIHPKPFILSTKCFTTCHRLFSNILWVFRGHSPEYNIPPIPRVPRIPFPVPVFLVLCIAKCEWKFSIYNHESISEKKIFTRFLIRIFSSEIHFTNHWNLTEMCHDTRMPPLPAGWQRNSILSTWMLILRRQQYLYPLQTITFEPRHKKILCKLNSNFKSTPPHGS